MQLPKNERLQLQANEQPRLSGRAAGRTDREACRRGLGGRGAHRRPRTGGRAAAGRAGHRGPPRPRAWPGTTLRPTTASCHAVAPGCRAHCWQARGRSCSPTPGAPCSAKRPPTQHDRRTSAEGGGTRHSSSVLDRWVGAHRGELDLKDRDELRKADFVVVGPERRGPVIELGHRLLRRPPPPPPPAPAAARHPCRRAHRPGRAARRRRW